MIFVYASIFLTLLAVVLSAVADMVERKQTREKLLPIWKINIGICITSFICLILGFLFW